ncbi:Sulfate transporter, CysZ-type [Methylophaga thiooxydans]|uniref:Sulfate transporter CysZ n=2 Tax=Methylophaga thiooxydans TaxID=392484 RepID=A0A0A0BGM8_9GAMM|nr:sulfate transporter CysZ [Methylophaga thiooxydans]KGM06822.1 Sulfate transporter, CysZ-type [Methylophaga thiooxydans]
MQNMVKGARYLVQGFSLINQPGIRRFAYLPMLINTLLFSVALWFGLSNFGGWLDALMPTWLPAWLESILTWLIWPLFILLLAIIVFFSFSVIANILAAPFNGILAEMVEKKMTGGSPPDMPWAQLLKDTPKMIFNELRKVAYLLMWVLPLLILSLIPGLNLFAPLLWLLFSSWTLALDYHDYPMGNHQLAFRQQRELLRQNRGLALGFGGATMLATMIPILNFLVIPAAVAGATKLYLENIQQG